MDKKYEDYIRENFQREVQGQWKNCKAFNKKMQAAFPELILKRGYIYSTTDDAQYPEQDPHTWLETADGIRIDPSVGYFVGMTNMQYVDMGDKPLVGSCVFCGSLCFGIPLKFNDKGQLICGNCHWTKNEHPS